VVRLAWQETGEQDDCAVLTLDRWGDASTYTLRLIQERDGAHGRPEGVLPRYDSVELNFKVGCYNDLDCKTFDVCEEPVRSEPNLDYLAKDYASFRRLMLDRLSLVMPAWTERNPADLGITLVELMAYVGDYLSYYQDAVATEAYLHTARQRISVRRHARLVDYMMHEGCNARAWLFVQTSDDLKIRAGDIAFVTSFQGAPSRGARSPGATSAECPPPSIGCSSPSPMTAIARFASTSPTTRSASIPGGKSSAACPAGPRRQRSRMAGSARRMS
jgi:hypothetical protein